MADRILNRDQHPQWQGERTKMVYALPTNHKLWQEYAQIRSDSLRNERGLADATAFYRKHRKAMDAGAKIAWPERFNPDELSAIQHAMNLRLQDEAAFQAEYQNEPLVERGIGSDLLSVDQICERINRLERRTVPQSATRLTAFIDVHQNLLFYVVAAWDEDFTGAVIDYGAWPDPQRPYFTLRDATRTLATANPGTGLEGAIYAGLERLTEQLLGQAWPKDQGTPLFIERCLIDANWGHSTEVVYRFCRQTMRDVLIGDKPIAYISEGGSTMLDEARRTASDALIGVDSIVRLGAANSLWFTWTGTRAHRTLQLLANHAGLDCTDHDGLALEFSLSAETLRSRLSRLAASPPDAIALASRQEPKQHRKYDQYVSDELLTVSIAKEHLDIDEAVRVLKAL